MNLDWKQAICSECDMAEGCDEYGGKDYYCSAMNVLERIKEQLGNSLPPTMNMDTYAKIRRDILNMIGD